MRKVRKYARGKPNVKHMIAAMRARLKVFRRSVRCVGCSEKGNVVLGRKDFEIASRGRRRGVETHDSHYGQWEYHKDSRDS